MTEPATSNPARSRRSLFKGGAAAAAGAVGAVAATASSAQAAPLGINLLDSPVRGYDSRVLDGKVAAKTVRTVSLVGIPPNSAGAIVNVNVTQGDKRGFVVVFPGGSTQTLSSTVKFEKGIPTSNTTVTKLGPANTVSFYVTQNVHVYFDITGVIA